MAVNRGGIVAKKFPSPLAVIPGVAPQPEATPPAVSVCFSCVLIAGSQLDDLGGAGGTGYPQVTGFIGFDDTGHRAIHRDRFGHGPRFPRPG